jgi:hypothetical protein
MMLFGNFPSSFPLSAEYVRSKILGRININTYICYTGRTFDFFGYNQETIKVYIMIKGLTKLSYTLNKYSVAAAFDLLPCCDL